MEILCKIGNVLFDCIIIQRVMNIHPFIYSLESKGFALSLIGQWQFVGLKRTNQLLNFDIIKVLALFNCCHLDTKAFWQRLKDLCYYFRILRFLPQIEFADNYFIQIAIERVKWLILTHFKLFEPSGQHLQLGVFQFLRSFVGGFQYLICFFGNGNVWNLVKLIWRNTTENCIQGFTVSISCRKGYFISSGFSSLRLSPTYFYSILNSIINWTQECPHPDFPKGIIVSIKKWWSIERLRLDNLNTGSRIALRCLNHKECTHPDTNWKFK